MTGKYQYCMALYPCWSDIVSMLVLALKIAYDLLPALEFINKIYTCLKLFATLTNNNSKLRIQNRSKFTILNDKCM